LVNALHTSAFAALVGMEGLTLEDLHAEYTKLTGDVMDDKEGTVN
jgi:hypothetical protein